ncbi:MAG TPA: hypothetical protein PKV35_00670, partial [bacterium]|nr:hypothetical protein [bacterium]
MKFKTFTKDGQQFFIGEMRIKKSVKDILLEQLEVAKKEIEILEFKSTNWVNAGIQIKLVCCEVITRKEAQNEI